MSRNLEQTVKPSYTSGKYLKLSTYTVYPQCTLSQPTDTLKHRLVRSLTARGERGKTNAEEGAKNWKTWKIKVAMEKIKHGT